MQDVNLRLEFHRAIDAVTPPAPWLRTAVREGLAQGRRRPAVRRWPRSQRDYARLLTIVAILVAVAIIVTLLAGGRLLHPQIVPVTPHLAAASSCPTWGYVPHSGNGGGPPASIKMATSTTGWAPGDLRTTDGGATFSDVSPAQLRSDQPFLPGQQTAYPPDYTDFFLDANHAWLGRTFESATACIDHITTYATADGGHTWRASMPVSPHLAATAQAQLSLDFIDPSHGWLEVVGQRGQAILYRTLDGGRTWNEADSHACPGAAFANANVGWMLCSGTLYSSHDGGMTWSPGTSSPGGSMPLVIDGDHLAASLLMPDGSSGEQIAVSSDGGATWTTNTVTLGGFQPYPAAVDFAAPGDFWIFVTPPGWSKGGIPTDWLYHSANGGITWQLVQKNTPITFPTTVDFIDATHGFVLQADSTTQAPQVLVTADGGHTWTMHQVRLSLAVPSAGTALITASADKPSYGSVYFASDRVAWEISRPPDHEKTVLLRTSDAGAHWRLWGYGGGEVDPVAFGVDQVLLEDSVDNVLLSSTDGSTWTSHPLPAGGSITFLPDLMHGWVYAGLPTTNLPQAKGGPPAMLGVWSTADGGATWRLVNAGYFGDGTGFIAFSSPTTGAIFQGMSAWLTSDGGASWHQVPLVGGPAGLGAQDTVPTFIDASHGILPVVIGQQTYFSRTSDGGRTWSVVDPSTAGCSICGAVGFLDDQRWIALNKGVFLSTDGGSTWKSVATTLPTKTVSGIELVSGRPGTAVVFAQGTYASMTYDWGLHWKAVPLPNLYSSYTGLGGSGGWASSTCYCI